MTQKALILLLVSVSLGAIGQVLFKKGMAGGEVHLEPRTILSIFSRPFVLAGLMCYGMATISYLVVLSKTPLALAYPCIALSYVVVVLMGQFFFHEKFHWITWAGVLVIIAGVALVGLGFDVHRASSAHYPQPPPPASMVESRT